jgi:hypothetical protein
LTHDALEHGVGIGQIEDDEPRPRHDGCARNAERAYCG